MEGFLFLFLLGGESRGEVKFQFAYHNIVLGTTLILRISRNITDMINVQD